MKTTLLLLLLLVTHAAHAASTILALTPTGDSVEDKRILLANSNFGRQWASTLGTNWTKVRLAIRFIMTNTAANITGTPSFAVGFCKGTNNLFLDSTTSNFVGAVSTSATWTYAAGPPIRYGTMNMVATVKVGANTTNGLSLDGNLVVMADSSTTNRSVMFVDITKPAGASTNFTLQLFYRNSTTARDATKDEFLTQAEIASPTLSGHVSGTARGIPVDENNGYLDTVCIGWNRTTPTIHICDVAVVRLQ